MYRGILIVFFLSSFASESGCSTQRSYRSFHLVLGLLGLFVPGVYIPLLLWIDDVLTSVPLVFFSNLSLLPNVGGRTSHQLLNFFIRTCSLLVAPTDGLTNLACAASVRHKGKIFPGTYQT
jgi:hypothetical protein